LSDYDPQEEELMEDISQLPNIGEVLAGKLSDIGITSRADLVAKGSIEAVIQIGDTDTTACYNMLYALEGAIRGVRWHVIPKEERKKLKEEFDSAKELK
jgi:DNA transformation protein